MVATGQVVPEAGDVGPHTHPESDVTGLSANLDSIEGDLSTVSTAVAGKAASVHTHAQSDVTALDAALAGKSDTGHTHAYADVTGKPATFTPSAHSHVVGDTTGLQAALDTKAPLASPAFTGTPTGITKAHVGLSNVDNVADLGKPISTATQTALDGKAASVHTHGYAAGGFVEPEDHGLLGWTMDPAQCPGVATISAAQVLHVMKLRTRVPITVTNIVAVVTAAGVTLTANRCYAALYDAAGNLLSQTADQAAAWVSPGLKVMALAAPQAVSAGPFYVGFMYAGTTSPTFPRGSNVNTASINMGGVLRSQTVGAALTAPPANLSGGAGLFTTYCWGVS